MSRFLVTGGAGFIGSHIVDELVKQGEDVRVLDNLSSGKLANLKDVIHKIDFIQGDISDDEMAVKAVDGIDYVLHQAALPSVIMSIQQPVETNKTIVDGTVKLFHAAVRSKTVKRIVQASSSAVYGNSLVLPKKEEMIPCPISPYAVGKLTQEYYARAFYEAYGLEVVSLRYFNVFGERQSAESDYAAVVPKFIQAMVNNRRPTIFGDGLTTRDFVHVKNIVNANMKACFCQWDKEKCIFNIGSGQSVSLNELVQIINNLLDTDIIPNYEKERVGDIKHSVPDIEKAKEYLKYEVEVSFEEGIKKIIASTK